MTVLSTCMTNDQCSPQHQHQTQCIQKAMKQSNTVQRPKKHSLVALLCLSKSECKSDQVGSSCDGKKQAYEASHNAHDWI